MEQSIWIDGRYAPGRSRTLRQFVARLCEHLLGVKLTDGSSLEREEGWSATEAKPAAKATGPVKTTRRRKARRVEQTEFLFQGGDGDENLDTFSPPPTDEWVQAPDHDDEYGVEILSLEDALPVRASRDDFSREEEDDGQTLYAERGRFAGLQHIGPRLALSGALDGTSSQVRRLNLPRSKFSARLRLWNEPEGAAERYQDLRFPPCDISSHGPRRADGNLIL